MSKKLAVSNFSNQIKEATTIFNNLLNLSRFDLVAQQPFKVIGLKEINFILDKTTEINEKIYNFSKSTSQISRKLQSLTMLFPANATYRILHQLLAQIERKQQAIIENIFKIKKNMLKVKKLKKKLKSVKDGIEKEEIKLEIEEIQVKTANTFSYLEAALKEIGYLCEAYEEIKKNKNIPDEWDEYTFEKAEIEAHIKGAFRNAVRDYLVNGRIGMGTCEWFEQLGISPFEAIYEVTNFLNSVNSKMNNGSPPDYNEFYDFLDKMAEKYKDCYKKACEKIGLNTDLISKQFTLIYKENEK